MVDIQDINRRPFFNSDQNPNKLLILLEKKSEKTKAWSAHQLALVAEIELDYKEAKKHFKRAVDSYPDNLLYTTNYADLLIRLSEIDSAEEVIWHGLKLNINKMGGNDTLVGHCYNYLGRISYQKGRLDEAIRHYEEALAIDTPILGLNHNFVTISFLGIGEVYNKREDYQDALRFFDKSLAIDTLIRKEKGALLPIILGHKAGSLLRLGKYEQAIYYFNQALEMEKVIHGSVHPYIAARLNGLGTVYEKMGKYSLAKDHFYQALAIDTPILGNDNHRVAIIFNNLGRLYYITNKLDSALFFHQKAILISKKLGPNYPDEGLLLNNLASVWRAKGEYLKAIQLYQEALAIDTPILSIYHSKVASWFNNLGVAYAKNGDDSLALAYQRKGLHISDSLFGFYHHTVGICYYNLGRYYESKKDYSYSNMYFEQALTIFDSISAPTYPWARRTQLALGNTRTQLRDYSGAISLYKKILKVDIVRYGNSDSTAKDCGLIGYVFQKQGMCDSALVYYNRGMSIADSLNNQELIQSLSTKVSECLEKLGHPTQGN